MQTRFHGTCVKCDMITSFIVPFNRNQLLDVVDRLLRHLKLFTSHLALKLSQYATQWMQPLHCNAMKNTTEILADWKVSSSDMQSVACRKNTIWQNQFVLVLSSKYLLFRRILSLVKIGSFMFNQDGWFWPRFELTKMTKWPRND